MLGKHSSSISKSVLFYTHIQLLFLSFIHPFILKEVACGRHLLFFHPEPIFILTAPYWLSSEESHPLFHSYSIYFRWGELVDGHVTGVRPIITIYSPGHFNRWEVVSSLVKTNGVHYNFYWNCWEKRYLSFPNVYDLEQERPGDLGHHLSTSWNFGRNLLYRKLLWKNWKR